MAMVIADLVPTMFLVLLLAVGAYVIGWGRGPERAGIAIIVIGSLLSGWAAHYGRLWEGGEEGIFLVDLAVLLAFIQVLARSDRFWPLWTTAFQLIAVATHLARFASPKTLPLAYAIAEQVWVYPMLILLGVTTYRLRKTRVPSA